jgi:cytochrome c oxidase assembly protein subunit 15
VDILLSQVTEVSGSSWTSNLEPWLMMHKNMALAVIIINMVLFLQLKKNLAPVAYLQRNVLMLLLIELLSGIVLNYAGLPPFVQPMHLLIVSIVFGYQFWLWQNVMMNPTN